MKTPTGTSYASDHRFGGREPAWPFEPERDDCGLGQCFGRTPEEVTPDLGEEMSSQWSVSLYSARVRSRVSSWQVAEKWRVRCPPWPKRRTR